MVERTLCAGVLIIKRYSMNRVEANTKEAIQQPLSAQSPVYSLHKGKNTAESRGFERKQYSVMIWNCPVGNNGYRDSRSHYMELQFTL